MDNSRYFFNNKGINSDSIFLKIMYGWVIDRVLVDLDTLCNGGYKSVIKYYLGDVFWIRKGYLACYVVDGF